jgi:N-acyl-D-amino-acid deacylase
LVYARGYGCADIGSKSQVEPISLFRIASISKPITAVAILQLVEQGKLNFDDKVFEILKYEPHLEEGATFDGRHAAITIRHLLEHRGGWDRDISFDGMFRSAQFAAALNVAAPAGHEEIIRCMLGQKLDFDPGERFAYSNYGYCLLGRVVEVKTGMPYERYVQVNVLKPIGIRSMCIGKTRLAGRAEDEVHYYHLRRGLSVFAEDLGQRVPWPYGGWHHESMDSHGAWIGSAVDLARFAVAFDDPSKCKLLKPESLQEMHARPPGLAGFDKEGKPKDVFYSLGWSNRVIGDDKTSHWHTGSLPGTAAILIRRHDGRNFIA